MAQGSPQVPKPVGTCANIRQAHHQVPVPTGATTDTGLDHGTDRYPPQVPVAISGICGRHLPYPAWDAGICRRSEMHRISAPSSSSRPPPHLRTHPGPPSHCIKTLQHHQGHIFPSPQSLSGGVTRCVPAISSETHSSFSGSNFTKNITGSSVLSKMLLY